MQTQTATENMGGLLPDAMENRRRRAVFVSKFINFIPLIGLVLVVGLYFLSVAVTGYRLSIQMEMIINKIILVAFVATGATFIFTIGSFDLSLGANMLLSAVVGSLAYRATKSLWLMVLVCVLVAIGISLINYLLAAVFHLPVFIMTVAMMTVLSTISSFILGGETLYPGFAQRGSEDYEIYHNMLDTIGFRVGLRALYVLVCCFLFYFTKLGRQQKFLGGNPVCAKLSGIGIVKMTFISFTIAGVGIGLAAFCSTLPSGSIESATGSDVGMNMLIAIVFGGMALSGGPKAKAFAAFLGGCTMAFLDLFMSNILSYAEVESGKDAITMLVKAILFLIVAALLGIASRSKQLPR